MKVAIWDTYIKTASGSVIHIDIVVPEEMKNEETIYDYGKTYLKSIAETGEIDADYCQYCHIEEPTAEMVNDINNTGFSIIRLEDIPKELPQNPNRRSMILHLRANYKKYRFANFRDISDAELLQIIQSK
jgi:Domain of unknown function (DUF2024)